MKLLQKEEYPYMGQSFTATARSYHYSIISEDETTATYSYSADVFLSQQSCIDYDGTGIEQTFHEITVPSSTVVSELRDLFTQDMKDNVGEFSEWTLLTV